MSKKYISKKHKMYICRKPSAHVHTLWVVCSHMLVSCLTLLNSQGSGAYYAASLVPAYSVLLVSVVLAVRVAGGSVVGLKQSIRGAKTSHSLGVTAEG